MASKVYTGTMVVLATLCSGPSLGLFLVSQNSRVLGRSERANWELLAAFASMAIILCLAVTVPEYILSSTGFITTFVCLVLVQTYMGKTQTSDVVLFLANGGEKQSGWLVVGLMVALWFIVFTLGFVGTLILITYFG